MSAATAASIGRVTFLRRMDRPTSQRRLHGSRTQCGAGFVQSVGDRPTPRLAHRIRLSPYDLLSLGPHTGGRTARFRQLDISISQNLKSDELWGSTLHYLWPNQVHAMDGGSRALCCSASCVSGPPPLIASRWLMAAWMITHSIRLLLLITCVGCSPQGTASKTWTYSEKKEFTEGISVAEPKSLAEEWASDEPPRKTRKYYSDG